MNLDIWSWKTMQRLRLQPFYTAINYLFKISDTDKVILIKDDGYYYASLAIICYEFASFATVKDCRTNICRLENFSSRAIDKKYHKCYFACAGVKGASLQLDPPTFRQFNASDFDLIRSKLLSQSNQKSNYCLKPTADRIVTRLFKINHLFELS
jgi:hypothetical protein